MVWKKMGVLLVVLVLASVTLGALLGATLFPQTVVEERVVVDEVLVEVPYEVEVEVPVEVVVEVPVEVLVDNGNLQMVLEFIEENHGNVNFIVTDLDEESVDEIVDRIVFMNEVETLILDAIREEFRTEINNRVADDQEVLKYRELSRIRYQDPVFTVVDFEYFDAEGEVAVRFEQDKVRYEALFEVVVRDGEVDDVRFVSAVQL